MAQQTNTSRARHQETGSEHFGAWQEFYQRMSEEGMAFFQQGMDAAQSMMPSYPGKEAFQVWTDSYQDFMNRIGKEGMAAPGDPTAYRRMYEIWLETWGQNLETYMRTPEFAAKSGKDLEMMAEAKKRIGEMLEAYWASIHLPSSADMRELYHQLYTIDRKLDDLDHRFHMMEQALKHNTSRKKQPIE